VLREARAISAHVVELELLEPRITFTTNLVGLGIVPAHAYGPGYARNPLGAGPFVLLEWREGEQLVVEPNPHWHGGAIPFPRITFLFGEAAVGLTLGRTGSASGRTRLKRSLPNRGCRGVGQSHTQAPASPR